MEKRRMLIAIHHPQYLPTLSFFSRITHVDLMVLLDDAVIPNRTKENFLYRTKIRTSNGTQWLSVPIIRHPRNQKFSDVLIDNTQVRWKDRHLNAMKINYSKSRNFFFILNEIKGFYEEEHNKLIEINMELINFHLDIFSIDRNKVILSSSISKNQYSGTQRIINICKNTNATTYAAGPAEYMRFTKDDRVLFDTNKIDLKKITTNNQSYQQCYQPFIENLSAMDLIFNLPRSEFNSLKYYTFISDQQTAR
jgi:hypothetical protein